MTSPRLALATALRASLHEGDLVPVEGWLPEADAAIAWISNVLLVLESDDAHAECEGGMSAEAATAFGLDHQPHYPEDRRGAAGCDGCVAASEYDLARRETLAEVRQTFGIQRIYDKTPLAPEDEARLGALLNEAKRGERP